MLLYLFPRVLAFSLEEVVGDSACGWSASTILGPRIFFLRLGYLLTSEVDGDRGSGGGDARWAETRAARSSPGEPRVR